MSLNGNVTNAINGQPAATRNGFLGLGTSFPGNTSWNYDGPVSLLHLNGDEGGYLQTQGYRNWMRNGITMTNNRDMMFLGPRRNGAPYIQFTDRSLYNPDLISPAIQNPVRRPL